MERITKFKVGDIYIDRNKRLCTIQDILTTTNLCGEIVSIRYVSTHDFLGQKVTNSDVVETTIVMAKAREAQS